MSSEFWVTIGLVTTGMLGVFSLVGVVVRYIILPNLDDRFVRIEKFARETHKQVTENHHSNAEPTLPDRLEDLRTDVAQGMSDVKEDIKTLGLVVEARNDLSAERVRRVEDALARMAAEVPKLWTAIDDVKKRLP